MLYHGVGPNGPPGLCSEWLILPDDSSQTMTIRMMTASTHQGSRQNAFFHNAAASDSFLTRAAKLKDTPERPSREHLIHITWRCFAKAVVFLSHSALSDPVSYSCTSAWSTTRSEGVCALASSSAVTRTVNRVAVVVALTSPFRLSPTRKRPSLTACWSGGWTHKT